MHGKRTRVVLVRRPHQVSSDVSSSDYSSSRTAKYVNHCMQTAMHLSPVYMHAFTRTHGSMHGELGTNHGISKPDRFRFLQVCKHAGSVQAHDDVPRHTRSIYRLPLPTHCRHPPPPSPSSSASFALSQVDRIDRSQSFHSQVTTDKC
jgi:hypothetical protein